MRLETPKDGRRLARRVLLKLDRDGSAKCRADVVSRYRLQAGALRVALHKLQQRGSRDARDGFAQVLTDALGVRRRICGPGDLVQIYLCMEAEGRFR